MCLSFPRFNSIQAWSWNHDKMLFLLQNFAPYFVRGKEEFFINEKENAMMLCSKNIFREKRERKEENACIGRREKEAGRLRTIAKPFSKFFPMNFTHSLTHKRKCIPVFTLTDASLPYKNENMVYMCSGIGWSCCCCPLALAFIPKRINMYHRPFLFFYMVQQQQFNKGWKSHFHQEFSIHRGNFEN